MRFRAIKNFVLVIIILALSAAKPLRLHVIANSDMDSDQRVKLMVRDAMLHTVENEMTAVKTQSEARQILLDNAKLMQDAAEKTLSANGFDYNVKLIIGKSEFPDRTYGNKFYPAGEYSALRVILGEGTGQNWWCVMYPPLCLGDLQGSAEQEVEFVSAVGEWLEKDIGKEESTEDIIFQESEIIEQELF